MPVRGLHFAAVLFICSLLCLTVPAQDEGPRVDDCVPRAGSISSVLELQGFRLGFADSEKRKVYFVQNGRKYDASTGGASGTTNDERHGPQSLDVVVPEGLVPGPSEVVVEVAGLRSVPLKVTIVAWTLPHITSIAPRSGAPGTFVWVSCSGIHADDEVELTDAQGKVTAFESGHSSNGPAFAVPKDTPEGVMTIRIGNRKYGNNKYTEPVQFLVTTGPLPLELHTDYATPVAPGQWIDLQAVSAAPLEHSELTQVTFKQGDQSIIVAAPNPRRAHVEVPRSLSAGNVQLRVRTWREGRVSAWSEPMDWPLAERPVPAKVSAIRLEKGDWIQLRPGPDRAKSFSAGAADVLVINGTFPVATADRLEVTLTGPGGSFTLIPYEDDENSHWFGQFRVTLPEALPNGDWRITIANIDDGARVDLPIIMRTH